VAIGRMKGPRVIVAGTAVRVHELPPSKRTGEVWASDVTVEEPDGGEVFVRFYTPRNDAALQQVRVGAPFAVWATAETGNRGEDLSFAAFVTADDLDRINSGLAVKA
jgi:hypothetical protein